MGIWRGGVSSSSPGGDKIMYLPKKKRRLKFKSGALYGLLIE